MGLHLIPLLIGAAAGAAATFVAKDKPTQEKLKAGADKAAKGLKRTFARAKPKNAHDKPEAIGEGGSA